MKINNDKLKFSYDSIDEDIIFKPSINTNSMFNVTNFIQQHHDEMLQMTNEFNNYVESTETETTTETITETDKTCEQNENLFNKDENIYNEQREMNTEDYNVENTETYNVYNTEELRNSDTNSINIYNGFYYTDTDIEYDIDDIEKQANFFNGLLNNLRILQIGDKLGFDNTNHIIIYHNAYFQSLKRWYYSENHDITLIKLKEIFTDYNIFNKMIIEALNDRSVHYEIFKTLNKLDNKHERLIDITHEIINLNNVVQDSIKILKHTYNNKYIELDKYLIDIINNAFMNNEYIKSSYIMGYSNYYFNYKHKSHK